MKKLCLAIGATMLLTIGSTAQVKFGIEGGINLNNLADQYEGETTSNQIKTGIHAGLLADIMVSNHFSVAPALRYIMKGGQEERNYNSVFVNPPERAGILTAVEAKNKLSYHYVEMPINIVYKTGNEGEGRFMIGAGPYIALMVNAQNKYKITARYNANGEAQEYVEQGARELGIGEDAGDEIKRLDYGAQGFVGYMMPTGAFVKAGSSVGFANTIPSGSIPIVSPNLPAVTGDFNQKNYNFFLTIGYMFNK